MELQTAARPAVILTSQVKPPPPPPRLLQAQWKFMVGFQRREGNQLDRVFVFTVLSPQFGYGLVGVIHDLFRLQSPASCKIHLIIK